MWRRGGLYHRLVRALVLIVLGSGLCVTAGCGGSGSGSPGTVSSQSLAQSAPQEQDLIGQSKPIRMTIGYNLVEDAGTWDIRDSALTIWKDFQKPIGFVPLAFPYNDRGPGVKGTMTYLGDGKAELLFPEENITPESVPPLHMLSTLPDIPVQVDIHSQDLKGYVDFKTGEVKLWFDARFVPNVFGYTYPEMSVVTDLGTGVSVTRIAPQKEYPGRLLNARGDFRLTGVAQIPKAVSTDKPMDALFVNLLLSLPTDAVTEMEAHFDFPEGRFPGSPVPEATDVGVFMKVGKDAELSIAQFPPFAYDGMGSYGIGTFSRQGDVLAVDFIQFSVPALEAIPGLIPFLREFPGLGFVRIEIETRQLAGTLNQTTGQIDLAFDASFTPVIFEKRFPSIAVVTKCTTETSTGLAHTVTGMRLDTWGDARLVGVAVVPKLIPAVDDPQKTEKEFINAFLGLPTDAVCELPVHIDIVSN